MKHKKPYEKSLKYYRDIKNMVDTSKAEGKAEGRTERSFEIAKKLKMTGVEFEIIMQSTGLTREKIEKL